MTSIATAESTFDSQDLPATTPEVKRYHRLKLTADLLSLTLTLFLLGIMAILLGPRLDQLVGEWVGTNRWVRLAALGFFYAAFLQALTLPLDFWSGFVLEHRYELSNQTLWHWIWKHIKGYLIGGPLGLLLLCGFYAFLWYSGPAWWLWATAGWLLVTLVLGRLVPVLILPLFYKVTPIDNASLLERLQKLVAGTGLSIQGIYRLHLSAETRKANAALTGLGRTRRVLLGDTLIDQFTPEEVEVVFAHEVGHHVHRHLPKMIVINVVLSALGFWFVDIILGRAAEPLGYDPMNDATPAFKNPAALPLLMLVLMVFWLVLGPAQNALSRYFERQCDRYALERTGMPGAYRTAFIKLAHINKADADPHPLVVWLFDDHPPIRERLAMARQLNQSVDLPIPSRIE
jgi:STE24 endopeptidase